MCVRVWLCVGGEGDVAEDTQKCNVQEGFTKPCILQVKSIGYTVTAIHRHLIQCLRAMTTRSLLCGFSVGSLFVKVLLNMFVSLSVFISVGQIISVCQPSFECLH